MSDNNVQLVGNVTRTPELRFTPTGRATCSFGLASNRRWQNKQTQEWEEATSFFDIVCWGELAEHVAESLERGARAIAIGRLEQRTWETPEGEKRSKVEVVADEVAPSLKWATAVVSKSVKTDNSGGDYTAGGQQPAYAPQAQPRQQAPQQQVRRSPAAQQNVQQYYAQPVDSGWEGNTEPF